MTLYRENLDKNVSITLVRKTPLGTIGHVSGCKGYRNARIGHSSNGTTNRTACFLEYLKNNQNLSDKSVKGEVGELVRK